jgi:ABC-type molybdate transport system substrate-binding protein
MKKLTLVAALLAVIVVASATIAYAGEDVEINTSTAGTLDDTTG